MDINQLAGKYEISDPGIDGAENMNYPLKYEITVSQDDTGTYHIGDSISTETETGSDFIQIVDNNDGTYNLSYDEFGDGSLQAFDGIDEDLLTNYLNYLLSLDYATKIDEPVESEEEEAYTELTEDDKSVDVRTLKRQIREEIHALEDEYKDLKDGLVRSFANDMRNEAVKVYNEQIARSTNIDEIKTAEREIKRILENGRSSIYDHLDEIEKFGESRRQKLTEETNEIKPINKDEEDMIVERFKHYGIDVIGTRQEDSYFVVECDNTNQVLLGDLLQTLRGLEDSHDIGYIRESNDNGFYGYDFKFFRYDDEETLTEDKNKNKIHYTKVTKVNGQDVTYSQLSSEHTQVGDSYYGYAYFETSKGPSYYPTDLNGYLVDDSEIWKFMKGKLPKITTDSLTENKNLKESIQDITYNEKLIQKLKQTFSNKFEFQTEEEFLDCQSEDDPLTEVGIIGILDPNNFVDIFHTTNNYIINIYFTEQRKEMIHIMKENKEVKTEAELIDFLEFIGFTRK